VTTTICKQQNLGAQPDGRCPFIGHLRSIMHLEAREQNAHNLRIRGFCAGCA